MIKFKFHLVFTIIIYLIVYLNNHKINSYDLVYEIKVNTTSYCNNYNNYQNTTFKEIDLKISNCQQQLIQLQQQQLSYNKSRINLSIYILKNETEENYLYINEDQYFSNEFKIFRSVTITVTDYSFATIYTNSKVIIDGSSSNNSFFIANRSSIGLSINRIIFSNWSNSLINFGEIFSDGQVTISLCTFNSNFSLLNNIYKSSIEINNSIFNNSMTNISKFEYFYFLNCKFINNQQLILNNNFIQIWKNSFFNINNNQPFIFNSNQINFMENLFYNSSLSLNLFEISNNTIFNFYNNSIYNNNLIINKNSNNNSLIKFIVNDKNSNILIQNIIYSNNILISNDNNNNNKINSFINLNNDGNSNNTFNINLLNLQINENNNNNNSFINIINNAYYSTINITNSLIPSTNFTIQGYNNTITSVDNKNNNSIADEFCNIINNISYSCIVNDFSSSNNNNNNQSINSSNNKVKIILSIILPINGFLLITIGSLIFILHRIKKKREKIEIENLKKLENNVEENVGTIISFEVIYPQQNQDDNLSNQRNLEDQNDALPENIEVNNGNHVQSDEIELEEMVD